jgi:hypothetical protein
VSYNDTVARPSRDAGTIHVYRLTRKEPSITSHVLIYLGDQPKCPFKKQPREFLAEEGRFIWKVHHRDVGMNREAKQTYAIHWLEFGVSIYMVVTEAGDAERRAMRKICETMEIVSSD